MKRKIMIMIMIAMILTSNVFAAVNGGETELNINGEDIMFDGYYVKPYEKEDTLMLPLRAIAENLGYQVKWNGEVRSVEIQKNDEIVYVSIGDEGYVNKKGEKISLDIAPEIKESRTFVPNIFFSEVLDAEVQVIDNKITVSGEYDIIIDVDDDEIRGIVSDVPRDFMEDNFYEYAHKVVASPVEGNGKAIQVTGNNHSDDMFMGIYKKLSGFTPNKEYIFKLQFDLGTNIQRNMMGIGGSPGSSVYVKAGFSTEAPVLELDKLNHFRLTNIDIGNQRNGGSDLKVVSNMSKKSGDSDDDYEYKSISNYHIAKADSNGDIYLMIGTDSGFEGTTTAYYDNIRVSFKEAIEYNLSKVQEADYILDGKIVELESGNFGSIPEPKGFIDKARQAKLKDIIDIKTNEVLAIKNLTYLRFGYTKKDKGYLSLIFSGSYLEGDDSFSFNDVLNIDMTDLKVIENSDFVKQDEESLRSLNKLFSEKLEKKRLDPSTTISNDMKFFYEGGLYAILFLNEENDKRETVIIFKEDDVKDYFNY